MSAADDAVLAAIHAALAEDLLKRIRKGEATAADLSVARQFLKDNNISAVPVKNSPLGKLAGSIPDFDADEDSPIPHH